ncbi:MAG: SDR family NAD(P)-dependent oxidoreductase [Acidobacteriaceae bacterium]
MAEYVFITGATGGLGSAFALECARRSYDLVLTDVRPAGTSLASYLAEKYHIKVAYYPCDLSRAEERSWLYQQLSAEGYRFWGLLNVAGTDFEGAFAELTRDQVLQILRVNIEATIDNTHAILKLRAPARRFMLVNVASLAAFQPMPFKAIYAATKRMLLDFTLAIGEEIQAFGSATALCPAGMPTNPDVMRAIFAQGFWGRVTTVNPDEVAHRTIRAALRGRRVVIPGGINQFIRSLAGFLPAEWTARFVGKRWSATQNGETSWQAWQAAVARANES